MQEIENYTKEKLTVDIKKANLFGYIIMLPVILFFGLPYYLLWKPSYCPKNYLASLTPWGAGYTILFLVILFVGGIVLHELIHGVVFARYAKSGFKSLKFGVMWKSLTPYCHCKEAVNRSQYMLALLLPALLLGIIPSVLAIIFGNVIMIFFGMFFALAASGDFFIAWLLRNENKNTLVLDHPQEVGCYVYRKNND